MKRESSEGEVMSDKKIKTNIKETIYVLSCKENKYYVGKTRRNVDDRFAEHLNKNGSEWTKKYEPINVIITYGVVENTDEDKYTKQYMKQYGIDNVRGGSYSQVTLQDWQIKALQNELCTAEDTCFKCNQSGHFARECQNHQQKCFKCNQLGHFARECPQNLCFKCKQSGHFAKDCKFENWICRACHKTHGFKRCEYDNYNHDIDIENQGESINSKPSQCYTRHSEDHRAFNCPVGEDNNESFMNTLYDMTIGSISRFFSFK